MKLLSLMSRGNREGDPATSGEIAGENSVRVYRWANQNRSLGHFRMVHGNESYDLAAQRAAKKYCLLQFNGLHPGNERVCQAMQRASRKQAQDILEEQ